MPSRPFADKNSQNVLEWLWGFIPHGNPFKLVPLKARRNHLLYPSA